MSTTITVDCDTTTLPSAAQLSADPDARSYRCLETFDTGEGGAADVKDAREQAHEDGWYYDEDDDQDFCPGHAKASGYGDEDPDDDEGESDSDDALTFVGATS